MKSYLTPFIILLLLVGACSESSEQTSGEERVKTVNVVTQDIIPGDFASYVRVVGTVETSDDINISAEVSGRVVRYDVEEGDRIRKGSLIVKIDDSKLRREIERLEAATAQSRENYERLKKVYEEDGIGSELDYLNARYAYEQNRSALQSLEVDLDNTSIIAPFNGIVEEKMVNVGEMVSPGMPVVRLIGRDNYKIMAGVPARYSDAVTEGDTVDVWFDTQMSDTLSGVIRYTGSSINPQNRTFDIEVELGDLAERYKVDMITNLRLRTYTRKDVIIVSEEFVYSKGEKYVVYLEDTDEEGNLVAREVPVKLGRSYKSDVIIEEGLSDGDKLLTIGSAFLDDGTRITIKNEAGESLASN